MIVLVALDLFRIETKLGGAKAYIKFGPPPPRGQQDGVSPMFHDFSRLFGQLHNWQQASTRLAPLLWWARKGSNVENKH
jgi:hypothetical protein